MRGKKRAHGGEEESTTSGVGLLCVVFHLREPVLSVCRHSRADTSHVLDIYCDTVGKADERTHTRPAADYAIRGYGRRGSAGPRSHAHCAPAARRVSARGRVCGE